MYDGSMLLDLLALITIILWPAIPLFWIPVHCNTAFFRRLGLFTYALPLLTWSPYAFLAFMWRAEILQMKIALPVIANAAGGILFLLGIALHVWTGKLLGLRGLVGMPEITPKDAPIKLAMTGPFAVVRHPTYLAHTLSYAGVFLLTGSIVVGISTAIDLAAINLFVIPLEERELKGRFGEEYEQYKAKVRRRFLPLF